MILYRYLLDYNILLKIMNPIYILYYKDNKIELIELSQDYLLSRRILENLDLSEENFYIPKMPLASKKTIHTYAQRELINYRSLSIPTIYCYFLKTDNPIINNPNNFFRLCKKRDIGFIILSNML